MNLRELMHKPIVVAAVVTPVVGITILAAAPAAKADLDPHYPIMGLGWCPGGGGGGGFGGFGGGRWCDGLPFADGTYWHASKGYAMGAWWDNPTTCNIGGGPTPPPAAPGGCLGAAR